MRGSHPQRRLPKPRGVSRVGPSATGLEKLRAQTVQNFTCTGPKLFLTEKSRGSRFFTFYHLDTRNGGTALVLEDSSCWAVRC